MNKEELKRKCFKEIDNKQKEIEQLALNIYSNPELGYKEFKTTKTIANAFKSLNLITETEIAYTGSRAYLNKKEGPTIAIIGELDCVVCADHKDSINNGNIHACGHNVQLANLYGCATGLINSNVINELGGNVEFIAIPSEECVDYVYRDSLINDGKIKFYGGKQEYLSRGGFDNIDIVLQCHMIDMSKFNKECILDTDCNGFVTKIVTFTGKAAHAGFAAFNGINALNMAQLALNNIHTQRETFRDEDKVRVSAIITEGGGLVNVVPSTVKMQIMVRAFNIEAMLDASKKVNNALKAAALALGGQVKIQDKMGYLPMKTDRNLSTLYRQNMIDFADAKKDSFLETYQIAGSTDLGDISQLKPCMHIWTGGISGGLHSKDYNVINPYNAYILPAKMLAATVIDLLYDKAQEAEKIKREYKPTFTKESYLEFMKNHTKIISFDANDII